MCGYLTSMMNNTDNKSSNEPTGQSTLETVIITNCVLNVPLMLISILGNTLVLAAIIRTPSIRSASMILLCSLAVSDLLVGFVAQPLYIAKRLHTTDRLLHFAAKLTGFSLCGVSLLTITAITLDRFLALHYHMRYATLVTKSRVKYTLATIWFLTSFVLSSSQLWNKRARTTVAALVIIICLIISTFCYIKIYLIVRRHQLQIHAQQQAVKIFNAKNSLNMVRLKRSAMNTFLFYVALIICYLPLYILLTFHGSSKRRKEWSNKWDFAYTAVFLNSSINPFLYCWRLGELRTAVVKTARQMLCKQTEQN